MSLPARPHLPMSLRGPPKEGRGNLTVPLRANEYAEIASSSARGGLLAMTRKGAHCMCPRPHPPQSERPFPRKRESRIPPFSHVIASPSSIYPCHCEPFLVYPCHCESFRRKAVAISPLPFVPTSTRRLLRRPPEASATGGSQ